MSLALNSTLRCLSRPRKNMIPKLGRHQQYDMKKEVEGNTLSVRSMTCMCTGQSVTV